MPFGVPGRVNVLHYYGERGAARPMSAKGHPPWFATRGLPRRSYVPDLARLREDIPDAFVTIADHVVAPALAAAGLRTIVQNAGQRHGDGFVLPMFPQSGLVRRRAARGDAVKRVIFVGCRGQLHGDLADPAFAARLDRDLGVTFDVVDKSRARDWGAAALEADLTLAVRPGHVNVHHKPPTKLVNAWCSGVPALLGPEPAYRRLRTHADDYVEVATADDAFAAIARLQSDAAAYGRLRARCAARAADYDGKATALRWAAVLFPH